MMFFKRADGSIYGSDGDAPEGGVPATDAELLVWNADKEKSEFRAAAQAQLDIVTGPRGTIIRCVAAGVAIPAAWTAYVAALRTIANGTDTTSTALPTRPAYPAGT